MPLEFNETVYSHINRHWFYCYMVWVRTQSLVLWLHSRKFVKREWWAALWKFSLSRWNCIILRQNLRKQWSFNTKDPQPWRLSEYCYWNLISAISSPWTLTRDSFSVSSIPFSPYSYILLKINNNLWNSRLTLFFMTKVKWQRTI